MEKAKILIQLIKEQGYSLKSFAAECGIPYTTLYGILKNGVGKAGVNNVITICKNLGITVEQLEKMAANQPKKEQPDCSAEVSISEDVPELQDVYLSFARDAQDNGISPDDIKLAIDTIKKLRGEK